MRAREELHRYRIKYRDGDDIITLEFESTGKTVEEADALVPDNLTAEQKAEVLEEAIRCRVDSCMQDGYLEGGYLWNTVRDLAVRDDIPTLVESISGDPECIREMFDFNPETGKPWDEVEGI